MNKAVFPKNIPELFYNVHGLYEGDLVAYFPIIFSAPNVDLPYHNLRHVLHTTWLCSQACAFYAGQMISPRDARNLLIGALFHDFGHTGGVRGNDDLNIVIALRGLRKHLLEVDLPWLSVIEWIIEGTEYPYKTPTQQLDLLSQILRDADAMQGFSPAWIQQIVFGLAKEWQVTPVEVLRMQVPFHTNLKFSTDWARQLVPESALKARLEEVQALLALLDPHPVVASA